MERIVSLQDMQDKTDEWIRTYGVRYFNELTNLALLVEEVGELARMMARRFGEQSFKEGETENLSEEMADILFVLTCLANQTGINLTEAMNETFRKKTMRDRERHMKNDKLK